MKKTIILLLILAISAFAYNRYYRIKSINNKPKINFAQIENKAKEALQFCKEKKFDESCCILIDMSIHSGLNRFYIYDFSKKEVSKSMLVGHGCGNYPWSYDFSKDNATFSNVDGSHCSSLGKYKIGKRAWSNWGINVKYVLHGLEKSNSNAQSRFIVFHSWEKISDTEVYPDGTAEGWGCPTISNNNMKIVDSLLQTKKKPVLMWIYN